MPLYSSRKNANIRIFTDTFKTPFIMKYNTYTEERTEYKWMA